MKHLIFLGYPGSGKGSVAALLKPQYTSIATGDLIREEIRAKSPLGEEFAQIINQGQLISDELAFNLVKQNLRPNHTYLFDGFARTLKQAEMLDQLLGEENTAVFLFDIPREALTSRILNRRICPGCGEIFNLLSKPSQKGENCDRCLTPLVQRKDDTPEVIKKRFDIYESSSDQILAYYQKRVNILDACLETSVLAHLVRHYASRP